MKKKQVLLDIARSLAVLAGRDLHQKAELTNANAYQWDGQNQILLPIEKVNYIDLALLLGIDNQKAILAANTEQFARGHGANSALLWGAKGMGKSSIVKALHADINQKAASDSSFKRLVLVEIHREDIQTLPSLMRSVATLSAQFLVYCDDLSFDKDEMDYKALKSVLDGGLEGRPSNVLFYATSNRRHLMPRDMVENETRAAIHSNEAIDEKVSLSDRFGLWLGFHNCDQPTYLEMVAHYCRHFDIPIEDDELRAAAIEWAATRGARSGRVAIQFVRQLAGKKGQSIN
ncbi:ATP-binding protein [Maritalea porphyrae]|uniref:ATPase AAA n=1 Tax=Maritalea porphyrae TaxID=880732 RepID=A0ABQ5UT96_9HYPH|nr:ATP-binding protein [Maritalea porphyrae]GLQ18342.1 ATPase AAA [Maritalea porphyrae]